MKGVITYEWWPEGVESASGGVLDHHKEALAERALEVIGPQAIEGFREGVLADNIHMSGDPEQGVAYRGYWSLSESGGN
ncbi:hypothetical protein ACTXPD_18620 [Vreelandella alkaliphila]|uniref:Uncharacterized protein n=1 Tax=Halomonas campaniensis TaxID=213554 RepID=A0A3D0KGF4_9GAMM|nr:MULTISPECIES: hypothetical protein [Halomonas]HCA02652.1 hypothetical protein [Halomonas campaniensis]